RKLIFQQNAVVVEGRDVEDVFHSAERVPPRVHFASGWLVSIVGKECFPKSLRNVVSYSVSNEIVGHASVEAHQRSVYLRLLPRALSTGYFRAFTAILLAAASRRSTLSLSARRTR